MPFVNGFGFLYRLRAQDAHRHTPVAIITGDSCIDDPALDELHDLEAEVLLQADLARRSVDGHAKPAGAAHVPRLAAVLSARSVRLQADRHESG